MGETAPAFRPRLGPNLERVFPVKNLTTDGISVLRTVVLGSALVVSLAACGGGGGGSSAPVPIATPTATPPSGTTPTPTPTPGSGTTPTAPPSITPTATPAAIAGKIVSIPAGSYGGAALQLPLSGAVVIIGPTLILGATPPPTLPAGDVQATTDALGNYVVSIAAAQIAPNLSNGLFLRGSADASGVTTPTLGYYVSVFANGADGKSANAPLPVHAFSAVANNVIATQRVSSASNDEAGYLAALNAARIKANPSALPMIFDENAEEAARQHAQDEAAKNYICHYDQNAAGPQSRYLRVFGLGADNENVGFASGNPQQAYTAIIQLWLSEAPNGGHYLNITDATRAWAGVTTAPNGTSQDLDEELITPSANGVGFYPNFPGSTCPTGTPNFS